MDRISVKLEDGDREKIETRIKQEYPRLRTISEVVRAALNDFLSNNDSQGGS